MKMDNKEACGLISLVLGSIAMAIEVIYLFFHGFTKTPPAETIIAWFITATIFNIIGATLLIMNHHNRKKDKGGKL